MGNPRPAVRRFDFARDRFVARVGLDLALWARCPFRGGNARFVSRLLDRVAVRFGFSGFVSRREGRARLGSGSDLLVRRAEAGSRLAFAGAGFGSGSEAFFR